MILCVTLNPCLDKTLTVPPWRAGENIRGTKVREVVGGKGNNVARALRRLGHDGVRPVTFLGGEVGSQCRHLLCEEGLDAIVIPSRAQTRVILTVSTEGTNEQTAFFDPDPAISEDEARALVERVEAELSAGGVRALALSGSSPTPATHSVYADLIGLARARSIPVFLDTYGPALAQVWGFWPDLIQLNRREASAYLNKPNASDADVWGLLERWARRGVRCTAVTDGPRAVLARIGQRAYRARPPAIDVVNPIGSGDSMLAGMVDGWLVGREPESLLRWAVACGVANALTWDAGGIDLAQVEEIEPRVVVEPH
jgi:1-phosphofructokinase family hexose kinase